MDDVRVPVHAGAGTFRGGWLGRAQKKADPLGIRKLEVLAGKERENLLNDIIAKEIAMEKRIPRLLD